MLRKINRLLKLVQFDLDNRDRTSTLIALISFWEIKCETKMDDNSIAFAEAVKSRIIRQRNSLEEMRGQRLPSPESLVIHLIPKLEENSKLLSSAGYNPKLQLKVKSNEYVSSVIEQIMNRWVDSENKFVGKYPLKLYPHESFQHEGYGIGNADVKILDIYHLMGCPNKFKLDYMWSVDTVTSHPHSNNENIISFDDEVGYYNEAANYIDRFGFEEALDQTYPLNNNNYENYKEMYSLFDSPFAQGHSGDIFFDENSYPMELKL